MDRLQHFLNSAAATPREQEGRHFRTWQRVSVQLQREIRSLVATRYFADEARVTAKLDRAFTIAVYSSCHPCYGERGIRFTYDAGDLSILQTALRSIGRHLQARLADISAAFAGARLKRRFGPVWHLDILIP
jgi:hypothetical protein